MTRRELIKGGILASTLPQLNFDSNRKKKSTFKFCLNTSTISKQNIGLVQEIELAAKVGFDSIEVWLRTIDEFQKAGGKLSDIKKRASDLGISIENVIGFSNWMSDDASLREAAIEQSKRDMEIIQSIGCTRMAAPPYGAISSVISLEKSAERYRALAELGHKMNVQPQLEIWGFSPNIHLVGQSLFIAAECGVENPAILADVYHLYKGGSSIKALETIAAQQINIFHINDYPDNPSRDQIKDSHRVMPGDGVAPLGLILNQLASKNKNIVLSLELFSEKYWAMPAEIVLREGLQKMKAVVKNTGIKE